MKKLKTENLKSIISIHENAIDQLLVKCDDNGQYSRSSCLRIHGVPFDPNNIGRGNRIGFSYVENHSGKKVRSIIVKFRSCKARKPFIKVGQGISLMVPRN